LVVVRLCDRSEIGQQLVLGGCTVLFSGLPAAVALFIPSKPDSLARRINQGLGYGFLLGMAGGLLLFFVFVAKVVS
jgi:hypothetical protein